MRESSGMDMPTILIYLITIYDDEEGSESSCITLVRKPQEGGLGARTSINTIFVNQLETQSLGETQPHDDSSKNDMDTEEQEEGMGYL
jgi:hypothetical protein